MYYLATLKGNNGLGERFEQKIIIYGEKGKPVNVDVGNSPKDWDTIDVKIEDIEKVLNT